MVDVTAVPVDGDLNIPASPSRRCAMKKRTLTRVIVIALSLLLTLHKYALAAEYPNDANPLAFTKEPSLPQPGYLSPITDPTTNNTVMRITDFAIFGVSSTTLLKHA